LGHGGDSVFVDDGPALVHIGGSGHDTVFLGGGSPTVNIAGGHDSIASNTDGTFSVHLGGGNDTINLRSGAATVVTGGGSDSVRMDDGAFTVNLSGGHDTISMGTGALSLRIGGGHDLFDAHDKVEGVISIAAGHDTILAQQLIGTASIGGSGGDLITATHATAVINAGGSNDTVSVAGAMTVKLGGGHDQFVDRHISVFSGSRGGSLNNIIVQGGPGHDTFTYEYTDSGSGGPGSNDPGANDGAVATTAGKPAGFFGDGRLVVSHFTHNDVLNFDDYTESPGTIFPTTGITQVEANAHMKVTDHGLHHDVTIVIDTAGGSAAGTIVLKGIGTASHSLNSIDHLAAAYHLQFSPNS
jgi:hypothetical protein